MLALGLDNATPPTGLDSAAKAACRCVGPGGINRSRRTAVQTALVPAAARRRGAATASGCHVARRIPNAFFDQLSTLVAGVSAADRVGRGEHAAVKAIRHVGRKDHGKANLVACDFAGNDFAVAVRPTVAADHVAVSAGELALDPIPILREPERDVVD